MRTITPPLGSVCICYLEQLRRNTRGVGFADKLKKGRLKIFQTALAICSLINFMRRKPGFSCTTQ